MVIAADFLVHATKLIDPKNSPQDIDYRCAVSRAYYSLFHEAKYLLDSKRSIAIGKYGAHGQVIRELRRINKSVSRHYKRFRNVRHRADYDLSSGYFTTKNSTQTIKDLDAFIKKLYTII